MNSPGLHYSSLSLCNRAHFTHRILLYRMHSFSGPLLFHAISLHISPSVLYFSDQSDYGHAVQMGVKFLYCLEFSAMATQWHCNGFKRTVNQQIIIEVQRSYRQPNKIQRQKILHAQGGSSFANCIQIQSHQGWANSYLFNYDKYLNISLPIPLINVKFL